MWEIVPKSKLLSILSITYKFDYFLIILLKSAELLSFNKKPKDY